MDANEPGGDKKISEEGKEGRPSLGDKSSDDKPKVESRTTN